MLIIITPYRFSHSQIKTSAIRFLLQTSDLGLELFHMVFSNQFNLILESYGLELNDTPNRNY